MKDYVTRRLRVTSLNNVFIGSGSHDLPDKLSKAACDHTMFLTVYFRGTIINIDMYYLF